MWMKTRDEAESQPAKQAVHGLTFSTLLLHKSALCVCVSHVSTQREKEESTSFAGSFMVCQLGEWIVPN
ncbi:hypothetical protein AMECASPLE_021090 [Ameca splendens]|uniref:Uncharacterized protein n=1 Tax=Ameca splendens TaxID=208324 RepID=A0ABV1AD10_9TELE